LQGCTKEPRKRVRIMKGGVALELQALLGRNAVTHEPEIGQRVQRVIRLRDGQVEDDSYN